jgi:hypothetical protein
MVFVLALAELVVIRVPDEKSQRPSSGRAKS